MTDSTCINCLKPFTSNTLSAIYGNHFCSARCHEEAHPNIKPKPKVEKMKKATTADMIDKITNQLAIMLKDKNKAYGNSALEPLRIFSKASMLEQLNVRIDDKLSRIANGNQGGEDAEWDLMGYLVLKRIAIMEGAGDTVSEDEVAMENYKAHFRTSTTIGNTTFHGSHEDIADLKEKLGIKGE